MPWRGRARLIDPWTRESEKLGELDAIIVNASGCGTVIKDYGYLFAHEPALPGEGGEGGEPRQGHHRISAGFELDAHRRSALEGGLSLGLLDAARPAVARAAERLLRARAGFEVVEVAGGASVLRIGGHLQYSAAGDRRLSCSIRKLAKIESTAPDIIATGNIGCMTQLASGTAIPIVHTVELLDWATGGPRPFQ